MFINKRKFQVILFFILSSFILNACAAYNLKFKNSFNSEKLWTHEKTDIKPDPNVVFGILKNNLRYVLLKNSEPKDRVSMHLDVLAGSLNEKENEQGLAHFLEHMLFNGTENFPSGELVKYFQKIGMSFGPDANAHTGFRSTVYDIFLPYGTKKDISEGLDIFKDYIQGALLSEKEIEKEKGVILSEKNTSDSVDYRTFVESFKFEFPDALISKRLPIGKEEVIKNASKKLLKDFYDTWYRPDNLILVMVGDLNLDDAKKEIEEKLSNIKPRAPSGEKPDLGNISHKGAAAFYHYEKEAGASEVTIENIKKAPYELDSLASRKQHLINMIGDMIVQRRLDKILNAGIAPFTSASISSGKYMHDIEYASISARCEPEKWMQTLLALEQNLRSALLYGFNDSEIEIAENEILAELDDAVKKRPTINSRDLSTQIVHALNDDKVITSPIQEKEIYEPFLKEITADDVYKAFKEIWGKTRLILVTGNAELKPTDNSYEKTILDAYEKSGTLSVFKPAAEKIIKFPYIDKPGNTAKIIKKSEIKDTGIIQIDFENGIRLNIKKTSFSANSAIFSLNFGYGRSQEPKNMPGIATLSNYVINESGTNTLKKYELKKILSNKNTNIFFSANDDSFELSGSTVPSEIQLAFQVLHAYILDMGFREEAYKLGMDNFKEIYSGIKGSVSDIMSFYGKKFLAGGDSRFGLPEKYEDISKIKLEDIKKWIEPSLKKDFLELSFVGDFDINEVIKNAEIYLGSLPKRKPRRDFKLLDGPVCPKKSFKEFKADSKISKSIVTVAFSTDDFLDIKKTRRLGILSTIFSNRLMEEIREDKSECYAIYAFNESSLLYKDYGVLKAVAHIKTGMEKKALAEIEKSAENIVKNGIKEDELIRAKKPVLTHIKEMKRNNDYWLDSVLKGSIDIPEKLEWCSDVYDDYASITAGDIEKLAEEYLKSSDLTVVIASPVGVALEKKE